MKRNKFALLTVLVLGSIAIWIYFNKGKGSTPGSFSNFAIADPATVSKIILKKNNSSILLERQTSGSWMVNGIYPVNGNAIKSLLYTFKNIDVKQPVGKSEQAKVIKELLEQGIRCEIYQNKDLVKAYYVGKQIAVGTPMVMLDPETMEPMEKAFITHIPGVEDNVAANYFIEERGWRDRTVFKYRPSDIVSVKMEVPAAPEMSYELSLKADKGYQVSMLSTKQLVFNIDTSAVRQYLSYFEQLNFERFETEMPPAQFDLLSRSQPLNILTVTDNTGKTNKVMFYPLKNTQNIQDKDGKVLKFNPERMLAVLNNGKDLVVVKFFEFGKVMPPATYFVKK